MVQHVDVALTGVLGPSGPGRKEYVGPGSFNSYANLEIRDAQILRGALPEPSDHAYVEGPWPNNVASR